MVNVTQTVNEIIEQYAKLHQYWIKHWKRTKDGFFSQILVFVYMLLLLADGWLWAERIFWILDGMAI